MEVLIQPLRKTVEAEPGANLLDVLRNAQVPVSYSCMAGRCGTCRCRVLKGDVLDSGRLDQNPLQGGDAFVLACQTFLTEPCTIEIPEPDEVVVHPARIVRATVQSVDALTHDVVRIVLEPAKPISFSPGQYARVEFSPRHVRPYSMASLASDDNLEFHVRVLPGGRVSGYIANSLEPGDSVRISGPLGTAYLRRNHGGPILCVAAATGLAPILAILRAAVQEVASRPIHLYFGVRSPRDVYGLDRLAELAQRHPQLRIHTVVASGACQAGQRRGLVTEALQQDLGDLAGWQAYLCGSPPMVEAAAVLVRQKGIDPSAIHTEAFYVQPD